MANYVEFFRLNDRYEDVFIEELDEEGRVRYVHASAEPYMWADVLACREWWVEDNKWVCGPAFGSSSAYLESLPAAPYDIASEICEADLQRLLDLEDEEDAA